MGLGVEAVDEAAGFELLHEAEVEQVVGGGALRGRLLFGERVDYLQGIGTAQYRLGRALLDQHRLYEAEEMLLAADRCFEQLSSVSHRAAVWVAQGDLARKRGADREAAHHYRRAAEALQDFRF